MAIEYTLSQQELNSDFPPADPAKFDEWNDYQTLLAIEEADAPDAVFYTHEQVMAKGQKIIDEAMKAERRKRTAA